MRGTALSRPRREASKIEWVRRPSRSRLASVASFLAAIFVLVTVNFFLPRAMPGDPLTGLVDSSGQGTVRDEATRSALVEYYGLDRPLLEQYGAYLRDIVQGDLGVSIRYRRPVAEVIADALPWTLLLAGTAMALATSVGLVAGVHSGWNRGRPVDRRLLGVFLGFPNVPAFFLGSVALLVFASKLGWFPLAGARTPFSDATGTFAQVVDIAHHLVLPAAVLAVQFAGAYYLLMRAGMVSELGSNYLLMGRAKGLTERRLKYAYAARNALLPVVTLAALHLGFLVTGTVFVERVFTYPGLGGLLFDAVGARDYPVLQGCFLVVTLAVVTLNRLADALYGRLDPRTAAT